MKFNSCWAASNASMKTSRHDQKRNTLSNLSTVVLGLVGVVVFYILSLGPVAWATRRDWISQNVLQAVYRPLDAFEDSAIGDLISRYNQWWVPIPTGYCGGVVTVESSDSTAQLAPTNMLERVSRAH
jgi:hypothetical protein